MIEKKPQSLLMDAWEFTAADLEANRDGLITERQRAMLTRVATRMRAFSAIAWVMFAVILGGMAGITYFGDQAGAGNFQKSPGTFALLVVVLAVVMAGVSVMVMIGWQRSNVVMAGKFKTVEGAAALEMRRMARSNLNQYTLKIGGLKLHITREMSDALVEGAVYRVNYIQDFILSIE